MAMFGCLPFWILLNYINANSGFVRIGVVSVLAGAGSGATGPIVKATLQNITLPKARGQAFALFNTFDDFGRGLGPLFVSLLIVDLGENTRIQYRSTRMGSLWILQSLHSTFSLRMMSSAFKAMLATDMGKDENGEMKLLLRALHRISIAESGIARRI
jgi:sugar phosphate permease